MSNGNKMGQLKAVVRSAVNSLGFDVVRLANSHGDLAGHLANVFARHAVDCVLDVGANTGQYGRFLRELGFQGQIISFEPVKKVFEQLKQTASGDQRWLCLDVALGEQEEQKGLNVYASTVFSSFLEANQYSKGIWGSLDTAKVETVRVARLDSLFPELSRRFGAEKTFLKMDTQGYDLNVFSGAKGMLGSVVAMQSELSLIPVYDRMPEPYNVLGTFHESGFRVSGMYPINRDTKSLAVIEYDCVLVRHPA